jgi:glycosyltransferase involved in cell wall biosynthesis
MRILIVTDAWHPQINGVVRTLETLCAMLRARGDHVDMLTPQPFLTVPMPSYPQVRLALPPPGAVRRLIEASRPDHVHIATEGPLGLLARRHCLRAGRTFTTSYHTRFPEYLRARFPVPQALSYAALRRFHNAAAATLVATPSLAAELTGNGFTKVKLWTRGVDVEAFSPAHRRPTETPSPVFIYVGRVAVEKNLPAFLDLDLPGSKVIVGDGPALGDLMRRYPEVCFRGVLTGQALAEAYASADVFVFPSRTDTFGVVLLEALASGLPVAAYPVTGPGDILADGRGGVLSRDLREACLRAMAIPREEARQKALTYSWAACATMFADVVRAAAPQAPEAGLRPNSGAVAAGERLRPAREVR